MPISVTCQCGKRLVVKDSFEGKRIKCPQCGQEFQVPSKGGAPAPPAGPDDPGTEETAAKTKPTRPQSRSKPAPNKSESGPQAGGLDFLGEGPPAAHEESPAAPVAEAADDNPFGSPSQPRSAPKGDDQAKEANLFGGAPSSGKKAASSAPSKPSPRGAPTAGTPAAAALAPASAAPAGGGGLPLLWVAVGGVVLGAVFFAGGFLTGRWTAPAPAPQKTASPTPSATSAAASPADESDEPKSKSPAKGTKSAPKPAGKSTGSASSSKNPPPKSSINAQGYYVARLMDVLRKGTVEAATSPAQKRFLVVVVDVPAGRLAPDEAKYESLKSGTSTKGNLPSRQETLYVEANRFQLSYGSKESPKRQRGMRAADWKELQEKRREVPFQETYVLAFGKALLPSTRYALAVSWTVDEADCKPPFEVALDSEPAAAVPDKNLAAREPEEAPM